MSNKTRNILLVLIAMLLVVVPIVAITDVLNDRTVVSIDRNGDELTVLYSTGVRESLGILPEGPKGDKGDPGKNGYVHLNTNYNMISEDDVGKYVDGILITNCTILSSVIGDYYKIRGKDIRGINIDFYVNANLWSDSKISIRDCLIVGGKVRNYSFESGAVVVTIGDFTKNLEAVWFVVE